MSTGPDVIHSRLWQEIAEPDDPYAAATCLCSGYDVYRDLLGHATWLEYTFLLLTGERPATTQLRALETLAVALANPGPRDPSVRAAMSAGVGGSGAAATLMAALAVGAGSTGGAREVALVVEDWAQCGQDLGNWRRRLRQRPAATRQDVWPEPEHPPGFDPHGQSCRTPVRRTLAHLVATLPDGCTAWLQHRQRDLEQAADRPLAMTGVAATTMVDLGLNRDQAEMLYLLLRLPGAAAHALEQRGYGWRRYPFFADGLVLQDDPGDAS